MRISRRRKRETRKPRRHHAARTLSVRPVTRPSADGTKGQGNTPMVSILMKPWFLLAVFTVVNALLAHVPMAPIQRTLLILAGLWLPLAAPIVRWLGNRPERLPDGAFEIKPWHGALFGAVFLIAHLYRLDSLPPWIGPDQALHLLDTLRLRDGWDRGLFLGGNQIEPLYAWLMALYLKAVPVNLDTVRLFPVLVSIATALLAYWAARGFLARPASLAVAWLTGLGFLPFAVSRMGLRTVLVLAFTYWALGVLGRHRRDPSGRGKLLSALHLGVVTGLGFYVYTSWAAVALWLLLSVVWLDGFAPRRRWGSVLGFVLAAAAIAAPMFLARLHSEGASYAATLFKSDVWNGTKAYMSAFLWDGFRAPPFGSAWGGSLNFLSAGLALTGGALWLKGTSRSKGLWALSFLLVCLLPGVLTRYVQMHRVVHLVPLFAAGAAIALVRLVRPLPKRWRPALFLVLLSASTALDAYHYLGPYQDPSRYNEEYSNLFDAQSPRAVKHLKDWAATRGPVHVLEQFYLRDYGAFAVPLYPVDVTRNRSLDVSKAAWVALLTNVHYGAFLEKEFKGMQWFWAGEGLGSPSGGLAVGLIPYGPDTKERLGRWIEANRWMREFQYIASHWTWGTPYSRGLEALRSRYRLFKGDRFLESIYFGKKASLEGFDGKYADSVQDLRRAYLLGYPTANLYFDLGTMLDLAGDTPRAARAYRYAAASKDARTLARERLEDLERRGRGSP